MCLYIIDSMNYRSVTLHFLLAPANITGVLTNKIETKDNDPLEILLFNSINSLITISFIYLLFGEDYLERLKTFSNFQMFFHEVRYM